MTEYVKAWQCIGCGKIEAPQTCIGVCQDRKVSFVYAFEHEKALAQLKVARQSLTKLGTSPSFLLFMNPMASATRR